LELSKAMLDAVANVTARMEEMLLDRSWNITDPPVAPKDDGTPRRQIDRGTAAPKSKRLIYLVAGKH
jgi:hypothetical protein